VLKLACWRHSAFREITPATSEIVCSRRITSANGDSEEYESTLFIQCHDRNRRYCLGHGVDL
jgi:hypothetical protein